MNEKKNKGKRRRKNGEKEEMEREEEKMNKNTKHFNIWLWDRGVANSIIKNKRRHIRNQMNWTRMDWMDGERERASAVFCLSMNCTQAQSPVAVICLHFSDLNYLNDNFITQKKT